jgi:hypothetical protein
MDLNNTNILSLARDEYSDKLCDLLSPCLYDGIIVIWNNIKTNKHKSSLMAFQQQLSLIPKWNTEIVDNEFSRICKIQNPVKLEKLLEAVFLFNVKILSILNDNKELHLNIPTLKQFIHKCYINCAREFYINPYIVDDRIQKTPYDIIKLQKNMKICLDIISNCIIKTIRECIPIEEILDEFLSNNNIEESSFFKSNIQDNRIDDEDHRIDDEDNRIDDEDNRIDKEDNHIDDENHRIDDEDNRIGEENNEQKLIDDDLKPNLDVVSGDNIKNIELDKLAESDNDTKIHNEYSIKDDIYETVDISNSSYKEKEKPNNEENFFN